MNDETKIKFYTVTLDAKDPAELAQFYAALLGWDIVYQDENYVCVAAPGTAQGGYPGIAIQLNPVYQPPVWPEEPDAQQQMEHIDFAVADLEASAKHAIKCGAKKADSQFSEHWTVMLDPAGHPFCLCLMKEIF